MRDSNAVFQDYERSYGEISFVRQFRTGTVLSSLGPKFTPRPAPGRWSFPRATTSLRCGCGGAHGGQDDTRGDDHCKALGGAPRARSRGLGMAGGRDACLGREADAVSAPSVRLARPGDTATTETRAFPALPSAIAAMAGWLKAGGRGGPDGGDRDLLGGPLRRAGRGGHEADAGARPGQARQGRKTDVGDSVWLARLGHFCDLCNAGLQQRIEAWSRQGVSLRCTDQAIELKAVRDAVPELAGYSCSAGQQVLRRLDKAFAAFFRRVKAGETPGLSPAFARSRGSTAPTSASATGWSAGTGGCGLSGSPVSSRSGGIASCRRSRRTRSSAARTGSGS